MKQQVEEEQTMMKTMTYHKQYLILLVFLMSYSVTAQVLNQDSKGESSIVYPGGVAYFNASEAQLGFSYNNLASSVRKSKGVLIGTTLKGETKTGMLEFLNEGKFVPSGKASGILGYYWNKTQSDEERKARVDRNKSSKAYIDATKKFEEDLKKLFDSNISNISDVKKTDLKSAYKLFGKTPYFKNNVGEAKSNYQILFKYHFKDEDKDNVKKALEAYLEDADNLFSREFQNILDLQQKLFTQDKKVKNARNRTVLQYSFYVNGGIEATSYKLFAPDNLSSNIFNSVKKENFSIFDLNIGTTWTIGGTWVIGTSLGWGLSNNFGSLSDREVTIEQAIVINSMTSPDTTTKITQKKTEKAYSIKPDSFHQLSLKFDVAYYINTGKGNVALNPYLRYTSPQKNSDDTRSFPEVTDLGLGAYFNNEKGKFQGGLYVQFNDLNNNRSDLRTDGEVLNFVQRIGVGLIAKIPVGSIFQRLEPIQ